jgi:thiol-disulfide isomerase/thioredoxin
MTRSLKRFAALAVLAASASAWSVEQGDVAPKWGGSDFDGRMVLFPNVAQGNPAVLVFWATWCSYCKAFMPYLEDIEAEYRDRGVKIVAVNAKEDGEGDPKSYVEGLGFPLTAVRDGDAIAQQYGVEFVPGLMVVGGDGIVAYRRAWTDLPAGRTVAELWSEQVRDALDGLLPN